VYIQIDCSSQAKIYCSKVGTHTHALAKTKFADLDGTVLFSLLSWFAGFPAPFNNARGLGARGSASRNRWGHEGAVHLSLTTDEHCEILDGLTAVLDGIKETDGSLSARAELDEIAQRQFYLTEPRELQPLVDRLADATKALRASRRDHERDEDKRAALTADYERLERACNEANDVRVWCWREHEETRSVVREKADESAARDFAILNDAKERTQRMLVLEACQAIERLQVGGSPTGGAHPLLQVWPSLAIENTRNVFERSPPSSGSDPSSGSESDGSLPSSHYGLIIDTSCLPMEMTDPETEEGVALVAKWANHIQRYEGKINAVLGKLYDYSEVENDGSAVEPPKVSFERRTAGDTASETFAIVLDCEMEFNKGTLTKDQQEKINRCVRQLVSMLSMQCRCDIGKDTIFWRAFQGSLVLLISATIEVTTQLFNLWMQSQMVGGKPLTFGGSGGAEGEDGGADGTVQLVNMVPAFQLDATGLAAAVMRVQLWNALPPLPESLGTVAVEATDLMFSVGQSSIRLLVPADVVAQTRLGRVPVETSVSAAGAPTLRLETTGDGCGDTFSVPRPAAPTGSLPPPPIVPATSDELAQKCKLVSALCFL
jgi:hypothetical protein